MLSKYYCNVILFIVCLVIILTFIIVYTYIHNTQSFNKNEIIERICLKCFISPYQYKVIKNINCFIPSYYQGRQMEINYTTYYDYPERTIFTNRIYYKSKDIPSIIRIRSYQYSNDKYIELKWKGQKMRGLLDNNMQLVEEEDIPINPDLRKYLSLIHSNQLVPVFANSYKRESFVLQQDSNVRVTLDSNLIYHVNNESYKFQHNILELKIPKHYSEKKMLNIKRNLDSVCNVSLDFIQFSKFEYGYNTYLP